jgi:long-subunit fatty acid transport protein
MKSRIAKRMLVLLTVLMFSFTAFAGSYKASFADSGTSARALALGGAYTAVADDTGAIIYNPAGLVQLEKSTVAYLGTDVFGMGIMSQNLDFATYFGNGFGLGVHLEQKDFATAGLPYKEQVANFAFAKKVTNRLSFGVTAKVLTANADFDDAAIKARGFGFEVGLLAQLLPKLQAGLMVKDLFTMVNWQDGESKARETLPMGIALGLRYDLDAQTMLAADLGTNLNDFTAHLGAERRLNENIVVRGGIDNKNISVGFGINYHSLNLDYGYSLHDLGATQRITTYINF